MMDLACSVKRYLNIFLVKPRFLLIPVLVPLAFYLFMTAHPVSYAISNSVPFPAGTRLNLPGTENGGITRDALLEDPGLLLLNITLLAELDHLITRDWAEPGDEDRDHLASTVMDSVSIEKKGDDGISLVYKGPLLSTGTLIVYFYSRKLGVYSQADLEVSGGRPVAGQGYFPKELPVKKVYGLWDQRRLYPLGIVTLFSVILMLAVVGVAEWLDSSLKNEQQAARYLDLPVLGTFPNFEELHSILERSSENRSGD